MTPTAQLKRPRTSPSTVDLGDVKGQVGYMMGKLESIEGQLVENNVQRKRMEDKIDEIPNVIRDAVKPLVENAKNHDSRIAALEKAEASEQGSIGTKAKIYGVVVALFGVSGTAAAIWEAFYTGK